MVTGPHENNLDCDLYLTEPLNQLGKYLKLKYYFIG